MNFIEAIVYGIVQGATEYLPVSSSAHLAFVPWVFGWQPPSFAFDVLVQLGTLAAVCVYLQAELRAIIAGVVRGLLAKQPLNNKDAVLGYQIVVATLPAVVLGLWLKDTAEAQWGNKQAVLVQLVINGVMLIVAEWWSRKNTTAKPVTWLSALLIGFAQAVAILPAISRSGATIACAMALGLRRKEAGAFSFLMSIPVMLGAGVLGTKDLLSDSRAMQGELVPLLIATLVAGIVGFLVIRWFLDFVRTHSLAWFGVYCIVVGGVGLVLTLG